MTVSNESGVAPEVKSILESARNREVSGDRIEIEARSFEEAVKVAKNSGRTPIISEIKPTSPTMEEVIDTEPAELAEVMEEAVAAAISVLTEQEHFGGSTEDLRKVREAVDVPVLRKDFILREEQLDEVKADLVLLIARFVDDLSKMIEAARDRGCRPLVEVHTLQGLERAVEAGAGIVGVNNRDLARLEVDLSTFERISGFVPDNVTLVAESGIKSQRDAERMLEAGADALLIGKSIMAGEVSENVQNFANFTGGDTEW